MNGCPDSSKLMAFMDGELPAGEAGRIGEHIRGCPGCRIHVESQRMLEKSYRDSFQYPPEESFRLMERRILSTQGRHRGLPAYVPIAAALLVAIAGVRLMYGNRFSPRTTTSAEETIRVTADFGSSQETGSADDGELPATYPDAAGSVTSAESAIAGQAQSADPASEGVFQSADPASEGVFQSAGSASEGVFQSAGSAGEGGLLSAGSAGEGQEEVGTDPGRIARTDQALSMDEQALLQTQSSVSADDVIQDATVSTATGLVWQQPGDVTESMPAGAGGGAASGGALGTTGDQVFSFGRGYEACQPESGTGPVEVGTVRTGDVLFDLDSLAPPVADQDGESEEDGNRAESAAPGLTESLCRSCEDLEMQIAASIPSAGQVVVLFDIDGEPSSPDSAFLDESFPAWKDSIRGEIRDSTLVLTFDEFSEMLYKAEF